VAHDTGPTEGSSGCWSRMRLVSTSRDPAEAAGAAGWPSPLPPWPYPSPGGPSRVAAVPRSPAETELRNPPELLGWKPPPVALVGVGRGKPRPDAIRPALEDTSRPDSRLLGGRNRVVGVAAARLGGAESVQARTRTVGPTREGEAALPPPSPVPAASLRRTPLHRHAPRASTPAADPCGPVASVRGYQPRITFRPVVSHHLDGFLRARSCGLVASRCRSWGSLRFRTARVDLPKQGRRSGTFPQRVSHPSKETPRRQPHRVTAAVALLPLACRAHRRPVPPRCQDGAGTPHCTVASASRPCSATESVTAPHRRRHGWSSPPLGFVPLRGRPAATNRSSPLGDHPLPGDRAPVRAWHPDRQADRAPPRGLHPARQPVGPDIPSDVVRRVSREGARPGVQERTTRRPKP